MRPQQESETAGAPHRRRWILWSAMVLVVLALAGGYWLLTSSPSATPEPSAAATEYPDPNGAPTRTAEPVPSPFTTPSQLPTSSGAALPKPQLEAVSPGTSVEGRDGIRVALTRIEAVQGQAVQPGEVGGPAVRVTVTITNATKRDFTVGQAVVNAYYGADLKPAGTLVEPGGAPLHGRLAPGASTDGIYLFSVPLDARDDTTITVDYTAASPTVVFRGKTG